MKREGRHLQVQMQMLDDFKFKKTLFVCNHQALTIT